MTVELDNRYEEERHYYKKNAFINHVNKTDLFDSLGCQCYDGTIDQTKTKDPQHFDNSLDNTIVEMEESFMICLLPILSQSTPVLSA